MSRYEVHPVAPTTVLRGVMDAIYGCLWRFNGINLHWLTLLAILAGVGRGSGVLALFVAMPHWCLSWFVWVQVVRMIRM